MTTRRRFLTILAAISVAGPVPLTAAAATTRWRGRALGAEAEIVLTGPRAAAERAIGAAKAALRRVEAAFNIYDPESETSRLNAAGRLSPLSPDMRALLARIGGINAATDGLFDPTVQSLWTERPDDTPGPAGWHLVELATRGITLAPRQRVTFNGIAQGYATDHVSQLLADHGFDTTLVNIGEFRGRGGPWRIDAADPAQGGPGVRTIRDGALATSAPDTVAASGHSTPVVDPARPGRAPLWSSVTVEADDATTADGVSTALCFADRAQVRRVLARLPSLRCATLVDAAGRQSTLTA